VGRKVDDAPRPLVESGEHRDRRGVGRHERAHLVVLGVQRRRNDRRLVSRARNAQSRSPVRVENPVIFETEVIG
jgi:hypothetical protein